ncbi:neutral zinc metallopeptidase [Mumia sp. zg.B17]|uniref:KPN_02809 family neutral zinc metallopeptidase n=1 Tax=unclassified Mumia TaxID=2621872 RepID=UPI001C6E5A15|nr:MULTISPECIES: neutral zinc metallopeptidase [unclassified Mumia]MBW9205133.1 neutral zinc metallopeptidase [Mumia sp. zg.B17]MBW9208864.1 neutral zinc metallopeptidase [Mumia sp. zg.B21]
MTFNEGASLDTSQVRSGGSNRGGALIGGGAGSIILFLIATFLGVNPFDQGGSAGAFDTSQVQQSGTQADFSECKTGADANRDDTCRVIGTVNSVQDYWRDALPADANRQYRDAYTVLYSGQTQSGCGAASSDVGPFYCPSDEQVYIDTSFFDDLTTRFGADDGALAQMYVVAHEYGHHVQNLLGVLKYSQEDPQGAKSGAVRVELMADCLAGVWANHAATTQDEQGTTLIKPLTKADIASALSAAAAVGDDRIQKSATGRVDPESWTHGSAEQRQRWFMTGYEKGDVNSCDTLSARRL